MFIRIFGRIFFLFYVCPFIRQTAALITREVVKLVKEDRSIRYRRTQEARARSRAAHPAGSRLPRP